VSLQFKPLHPVFVAEASGIDLTRPLSLDEIKQFNAGMNRYGVLVIRGQPLTGQQQIDFAQSFGPLDTTLKRVFKRPERLEDERLIDISNVDAQGAVAGRDSPRNLSNVANQLWHSDSSFQKPRAKYSMLSAVTRSVMVAYSSSSLGSAITTLYLGIALLFRLRGRRWGRRVMLRSLAYRRRGRRESSNAPAMPAINEPQRMPNLASSSIAGSGLATVAG